MKIWLAIAGIATFILVTLFVGVQFLQVEAPKEVPANNNPLTALFQNRQKQEQQFTSDINSLIATDSAKIAVVIVDLKSEKGYQFAAQDSFLAASTMKTLVAIYTLNKIQKKELAEDVPLGNYDLITQVKFMMRTSSNESWALLNDLLGLSNIAKFGQSLGMQQVNTKENLISAADLSILLTKLYRGEILDDGHRNLLFSFMHDTETEDRIPAGLPKETKIYHKSGTFANVVHDSAIVDDGKRPFVLVVLSSGEASEKFKVGKIVEITKRVCQFENE